ncbi:MAG: hypothetical protein KJT03_10330, partial [Verrucomicrobiae bacterium]|nr:hypothetical protein [Verrucomicrobiae bacterium]
MKEQTFQDPKKRGSILVIAMIFGLLLLISAGVLLDYGVTEKTINHRHFLRLEAQAAAESAVEYGFAELQGRWQHQTNFKSDELTTDPLTLPSTISSFFKDSNLLADSMEIKGGLVSSGRWVYINPKDPANMLDPQKQKRVFTRDVEVFGKATMTPPTGERNRDAITAYCAQLLEVRDAPLFGHAIFYNMDLEFHPGPAMDIFGPVHSNSNIYVQADSGLKFHSNLMAAGNIWHRYKPKNAKSTSHLGPVQIKDVDGNWKDMYKGSGDKTADSSYYDSSMGDDWKMEAEDRWKGVVGTKDHEVPNMRALSIKDYVPDDPSTSAVNELENHAYALIEPQLSKFDAGYKGTEVQKQQFSYKAGLVLRIREDSTQPSGYDYDFYTYSKSIPSEPNSNRSIDSDGKPVEKLLDKINLPAGMVSISKYAETSGKPTSGFYDKRQAEGMDTVDIDISLLKQTVDSNDPSFDSNAWNDTYKLASGSAYDWNGIVYVEIPTSSGTSGRVDKVKKAKNGIAVRLKNGSEIPSPPGSPDKGFTLATNAPLYVMGNFNADGVSSTGSSTAADSSSEPPAALIADAITILSNDWETNHYDYLSKNSSGSRPASFTEVSAAFLTGQSPTVPGNSSYSGGVHNFPRFLENWSGVEFRYRGSLVSLFESEVNDKGMTDSQNWYSPPRRNWGFSS